MFSAEKNYFPILKCSKKLLVRSFFGGVLWVHTFKHSLEKPEFLLRRKLIFCGTKELHIRHIHSPLSSSALKQQNYIGRYYLVVIFDLSVKIWKLQNWHVKTSYDLYFYQKVIQSTRIGCLRSLGEKITKIDKMVFRST